MEDYDLAAFIEDIITKNIQPVQEETDEPNTKYPKTDLAQEVETIKDPDGDTHVTEGCDIPESSQQQDKENSAESSRQANKKEILGDHYGVQYRPELGFTYTRKRESKVKLLETAYKHMYQVAAKALSELRNEKIGAEAILERKIIREDRGREIALQLSTDADGDIVITEKVMMSHSTQEFLVRRLIEENRRLKRQIEESNKMEIPVKALTKCRDYEGIIEMLSNENIELKHNVRRAEDLLREASERVKNAKRQMFDAI